MVQQASHDALIERSGTAGPYTFLGPDGVPFSSTSPGKVGGNRRTKVYGRFDCPAALRGLRRGTYQKNRVFFADEITAATAGYRPCGVCMKKRGATT